MKALDENAKNLPLVRSSWWSVVKFDLCVFKLPFNNHISMQGNSPLFFGLSLKRERQMAGKRSIGSETAVYFCIFLSEGNPYLWEDLSHFLHNLKCWKKIIVPVFITLFFHIKWYLNRYIHIPPYIQVITYSLTSSTRTLKHLISKPGSLQRESSPTLRASQPSQANLNLPLSGENSWPRTNLFQALCSY